MCDLYAENVTIVSWMLDGVAVEPAHGDVLNDGTLMVKDSSQVFDSTRSTIITCSRKNSVSIKAFLGGELLVESGIYLPYLLHR